MKTFLGSDAGIIWQLLTLWIYAIDCAAMKGIASSQSMLLNGYSQGKTIWWFTVRVDTRVSEWVNEWSIKFI